MYNICYIFLLFLIYSFIGYIIECIYCSIIDKKIVKNRGFLIGPYLPIYGNGALLMIYLLKEYISYPIILFTMSALIATILEYLTSYFMEKIFKARWWDYSDNKFNLNGRICLENTILFGMASLVIMYIINPNLVKLLNSFNNNIIIVVGIVLIIIYLIDNILSWKVIYSIRNDKKNLKDSTIEISEKVRKIIRKNRILKNRLINAFPELKKHNIFNAIKELLEK